jgi:type IV secretory pathway TraG/TraD family ATPase VirD4
MSGPKLVIGLVAGLVVCAGFAIAGQFAGSTLFAKLEKLPDSVIGVTTLYRYWHAYGDVPAVKRALAICTVLSVVVGALPLVLVAILAAMSRTDRELHGSARFANRMEIVKAGLVERRK